METISVTPAVQNFVLGKRRKRKRCWGIIVDTREQIPYEFAETILENNKPIVPLVSHKLESGDYSIFSYSTVCERCGGLGEIAGLWCSDCWATGLDVAECSSQVAVERKSLSDLYGSLGSGRERFEREIVRLNELQFAAVVIEATMPEVMKPSLVYDNWHSQLLPKSVFGSITAWSIRYPRVHWFAAGSRVHGEFLTYSILEMFFKEMMKVKE